MKKNYFIPTSILCFALFCIENLSATTDTLRHYNPSAGTTSYTGYVLEAAYFVPQGPCTLQSVIVALGGTTGTATVHIYGHEGGNTVPQLEKDLITPIVINKTISGTQKILVNLPTALFLPNNHFYVGISNLTSGTTLLSDNQAKAADCVSTTGGSYYYQYKKNSSGTWYYSVNAYVIDAIVDYPAAASPAYYKNRTLAAGIDTSLVIRSVAWADFNQDNFIDLSVNNLLYKNNGNGTFTNITAAAGINTPKAMQGTLFVDMDNDGNLDLVHFLTKDSVYIFKNNGNETFTRYLLTYLSGFKGYKGLSSLNAADVDLDKYPDLFLGRLWTTYPVGGIPDAPENILFWNNHNWGLVDTTSMIYPPAYGGHRSRGSEWVDFDNDGDLDLYVANYYLERDEFWQNNGNGTFTNIIASKGMDINSQSGSGHGTGVDWSDYDNDGDMDLLLSQLAHPNYVIDYDHRGTTIYRNEGAPGFSFTDLNDTDGIDYEETHSGGSWGDCNNDGLADIYITVYYGCRYVDLYLQKPDHNYEMKTYEYGFQNLTTEMDAVWVDYDNDGKLDLSSSAGESGLFRLYHNEAPVGGNYIQLDLKSVSGNNFAIGARVTVYAGGQVYMQEVSAGRGQLMQKPNRLHFGLAANSTIDSVVVKWPNTTNSKEKFTGINVNKQYILVEGGQIIINGIGELNNALSFHLYPNPSTEMINIEIASDKQQTIQIQITDVLGKVIWNASQKIMEGDNRIAYKTNQIPSGLYFIRLCAEKNVIDSKFIKQ